MSTLKSSGIVVEYRKLNLDYLLALNLLYSHIFIKVLYHQFDNFKVKLSILKDRHRQRYKHYYF